MGKINFTEADPSSLNNPERCGDHPCDLLTAYRQGTITFVKGMDLVKMAKGLMEAIYQNIERADLSQRIWQQIGDFMQRQGGSMDSEYFRRRHAQFLLDVKQLPIICYRFDSRFYWGKEEITRSL